MKTWGIFASIMWNLHSAKIVFASQLIKDQNSNFYTGYQLSPVVTFVFLKIKNKLKVQKFSIFLVI